MRHWIPMLLLACVLAVPAAANAQQPDNAELSSLYDADQQARADRANIDWNRVAREDAERRARVLALMREGAVRSAEDHFRAAMVFQHGSTLADYRIAHALATLASALDPERVNYRWLIAASWDRMTAQLQPQWYGTQFHGSDTGMFLYPVAEDAVDDAERARMGTPSLAEARANLVTMAASTGQTVRPDPPTIEALRRERAAAKAP
ncbi:hypothetical protein [Luteimonas terrae]|uniref:Uncharacterized protein n=1 Tax=Luteimonas terrae TaxID=1530191 RepID=A0A4R5UCU6_9GAMM|nr:hypothetical protein [Luteimonas terrae]TDK32931.1 hypothetical protein E2F49_02435 [Luteimonas terrae]